MGTVVPVCPRWRTARCDQLDDSIQVWRPVVESAWCELSLTPGGVGALSTRPSHLKHPYSPQEGWGLSLTGPASSSTPPHQGVSLTPGGSLYLVQSNSSIYILSHDFLLLCNLQIHIRMRITGRFKGCFLSVHMVNF